MIINWLYFQILLLMCWFTAKYGTKLKLKKLIRNLFFTLLSLYLSCTWVYFLKPFPKCFSETYFSHLMHYYNNSVLLLFLSFLYLKRKTDLPFILYSTAKLLMMDKTNGHRMQYKPGTTLPSGLMMDNCLDLMPTPSLIFRLLRYSGPFLTGIFVLILYKFTRYS